MKTGAVWIAFTKSRPLPGCSIDIDDSEFYFCEVYVPVGTPGDPQIVFEEIIGKTRDKLLASRVELVDISMIVRFDPSQWEAVGDFLDDVHELAKSAEARQKVITGAFRSEEIEEETQYRHTIFDQ